MIERFECNTHIEYRVTGKLHRPNGPAWYTWYNDYGDWYWFMNGVEHRCYGPQDQNGYWCIHGKWIK